MKSAVLAVLAGALAVAGFSTESIAASFPVPELESYKLPSRTSWPPLFGMPKIRLGRSTREDVIRVLGIPPIGAVGGHTVEKVLAGREWSYPVRVGTKIRAPMLKVWVDGAGVVTGWEFQHPVTGEPLQIRETYDQAMTAAWRAKSLVRLVLADLLRPGVATERTFVSSLTVGSGPKYTRQPEGEGHLLTFFVDRPSPLFVPANILVVRFNKDGVVSVISNERSNFFAGGGR